MHKQVSPFRLKAYHCADTPPPPKKIYLLKLKTPVWLCPTGTKSGFQHLGAANERFTSFSVSSDKNVKSKEETLHGAVEEEDCIPG